MALHTVAFWSVQQSDPGRARTGTTARQAIAPLAQTPIVAFLRQIPAYAILLCLFLVLNAFSGNWDYMGLPGPIDRAVLVAAVVLYALDPRTHLTPQLRWTGVHTAMAAFSVWVMWSALAHGTLFDSLGFYALLDRVIVPFVLFCLAPGMLALPQARRLVLITLVGLGVYLGLTALAEMSPARSFVVPSFIVNDALGIHPERARGPFLAAEPNGMMLAIAFYACFIVGVTSRGVLRWGAWAAAPVCLAGVALSLTRSVWLGLVVGVVIVGVVVPALRQLVAAMVAASVAVVGLTLAASPALREFLMDRLTTQRSLDDRANTNEAALRIVQESPLTGIGWTNFVRHGVDWVRLSEDYPLTNVAIEVHNVPLSRAAELGVIAAAVWVGIVLVGPVRSLFIRQEGELLQWRIMGIGIICVWVVPTLMSPNPYPLPNNMLWLIAGVLSTSWLAAPRGSVGEYPALCRGVGGRALGVRYRENGYSPQESQQDTMNSVPASLPRGH